MAIENSQTIVKSKAGSPNYKRLNDEGRMPEPMRKDGKCTQFDPNPNPKQEIKSPVRGTSGEYNVKTISRGYARGAGNIWRVGYSAEEHLENMILAENNAELGKDVSFVPTLHAEEEADFIEFLEKKGMRISKGILVKFEAEKKEIKTSTKLDKPLT